MKPALPFAPRELPYVGDPAMGLAVDVAIAARRPLLLRGHPGSGKTTLAEHVAFTRGWSYLRHTVTSRTQAKDLCWRYDAIKRLAAGADGADAKKFRSHGTLWDAYACGNSAVVLVDEIDKADPDVPNDLLEVFGEGTFRVDETDEQVSAPADHTILLVLTTNEERDLPPAFLRRCVVHWLDLPKAARLVEIAVRHFDEGIRERVESVVEDFVRTRELPGGRVISTAEFLDAVRAAKELPDGWGQWDLITRIALTKERKR